MRERLSISTFLLATGLQSAAAAAQSARPAVAACADSAGFAVLGGADTVGTGWTRVAGAEFASAVYATRQGALVRFAGRRAPDGLVERLTVRTWHRAADSAGGPTQVAEVRFPRDSVVAVVRSEARGEQVQAFATPPGSMPYMANVPLFWDLLQRRLQAGAAGARRVPVYWLFTGEPADTGRVERPTPGVLVVGLPHMRFTARTAPSGALLGVEGAPVAPNGGDALRIVRIGPVACR
jgi:hypothetical protein